MQKKIMNGIIRRAKKLDIDSVYAIELSQSTSPWKRMYFEDEVTNDLSYFFVLENYITNEIIGFIIFWIIDDIAELHSISISENNKKCGNGLLLINSMFDFVKKKKIKEVFLEVRATNIPAINLYKKMNFIEINRRLKYYKSPIEDAIVFKKNIL